MPYYQDVYDHVLRASEWTESLRDLVATILETNLTIQGNRLNVITKKVTSWAAIIAVPTAITGFYGQNVPYPGFAHHSGFITSSLLIVRAVPRPLRHLQAQRLAVRPRALQVVGHGQGVGVLARGHVGERRLHECCPGLDGHRTA